MFIGEHQHAIDPKGRIIIPSKFRSALGEKFVVTKGLDSCLFVYPDNQWQILAGKISSLPLTDKNVRMFIRFFFAGASECELDKQGRALIPPNLRDYAKLEKEIYITGAITRIEIWNKQIWEDHSMTIELEHPSIINTMIELGI